MAFELITKAEYKAYAGINSTNSDTEIDALLSPVSELIKNYCGRRFLDYFDESKTEMFNGDVEYFRLSESPIVRVLGVEYSSDYGQNWTALVEYLDWVLDGDKVYSLSTTGWLKQLRGYRVTYTAGYETVPTDLKLATMDLLTYYRQNDSAIHSTKAPGTNSVQIEYVSGVNLPAHIKRVLDLYVAGYA
jgi:hypothetical protein